MVTDRWRFLKNGRLAWLIIFWISPWICSPKSRIFEPLRFKIEQGSFPFYPKSQAAISGSRYFKRFDLRCPSNSMLDVIYAASGEKIHECKDEEIADASVKALKQRLAQKLGLPRFQLRLLQGMCPLRDDQTLPPEVVELQLVILSLKPPDAEQDQDIIKACCENDDRLLEQHLNQPRSPNFQIFQHASQITPLYAAAAKGSLKCVLLLLEAGAEKEKGEVNIGETPLFAAAWNGHLDVVQCLIESSANMDHGRTENGATPLFAAAQNGHLEVVRFLVESCANKDQGRTDIGATPLSTAAQNGHLEVVRFLVESGANKDQGRTDDGAKPLFAAAQDGHLEVV